MDDAARLRRREALLRIYGIDRDRPSLAKYGRALLIAAGAGLPAMACGSPVFSAVG